MNHKYIDLVQNIQSSNAQTINDMSNKIFELETQLHESEKLNDLLRRENEVLKYNINTNCGLQVKELEKNIVSNSNFVYYRNFIGTYMNIK